MQKVSPRARVLGLDPTRRLISGDLGRLTVLFVPQFPLLWMEVISNIHNEG